MKNRWILIAALMFISCVSAFAAGVPAPATPRIMANDAGDPVSPTNPLPVISVTTPAAPLIAKISAWDLGCSVVTVPAVGTLTLTLPAGIEYFTLVASVPFQMNSGRTSILTGTAATIGGTFEASATSIITLGGYLGATSTVTFTSYGRK